MVENHQRSALLFQDPLDLFDFSRAREMRRVGPVAAPLDHGACTDSRARGEQAEFLEPLNVANIAEVQPDKNGVFAVRRMLKHRA